MFDFKLKKAFFDSEAVKKAMSVAARRVLTRIGGKIRVTARRSIKKAPFLTRKPRGRNRTNFTRKTSKPGNPPYSQIGTLKRFIFFAYDFATKTVVIGPEKIVGKKGSQPEALEHGGWTHIALKKRRLHSKGRALVERKHHSGRALIAKRPYMAPALDKNQKAIKELWKNSIKRK